MGLFCFFGLCRRCVAKDDAHGCWGECIDCGRRHGYVRRTTIRRYIDTVISLRH